MPKVIDNVREEIIKATREIIMSDSNCKINMREIANKCNIGVGTIYNYFSSKQELIISTVKFNWDTAMKNIDKSNKTKVDPIEKLELIYCELRFFMNHIHNIRYENYFDKLEIDKIEQIRMQKHNFNNQLAEKIYESLSCEGKCTDEVVCSILSKIFFSYCGDLDINYEDLKPYIIKLIN